ncbi:uncharacterized protein [Dysidea avara]|uniref:uncharacterized protein isoform X1 n=2 Tax=Dysidea avara TaxID=196820 RepID=UPI00331E62A1
MDNSVKAANREHVQERIEQPMEVYESYEESPVNLLKLPTELLVFIISFLSLLHDRIKLRYVSRWLRCVTEGTPSLWAEFVWPYYDSREECSVKEVLKVCGQHIKLLSLPNCRVSSIPLQYCSNVQHLSLPSTKLDPDQLRNTIHHMGCLQTLELKVEDDSNIEHLLLITSNLREMVIHIHPCSDLVRYLKFWKEGKHKPPNFGVVVCSQNMITSVVDYVVNLNWPTTIPTAATANFRVYNRSSIVPLKFSPTFKYLQLQVKESSQVAIPCVKLSDFGILGLRNDLSVMTDYKLDGRTMYAFTYGTNIALNLSSLQIAKFSNLSCATHFDLSRCNLLHSSHLEKLAIACPNLRRLNLGYCDCCLQSLQGLQAIASHCHNLHGLNLLGIHVSKVKNHILLWEILSDMKLTHLAVDVCILKTKKTKSNKLVSKVSAFNSIRD